MKKFKKKRPNGTEELQEIDNLNEKLFIHLNTAHGPDNFEEAAQSKLNVFYDYAHSEEIDYSADASVRQKRLNRRLTLRLHDIEKEKNKLTSKQKIRNDKDQVNRIMKAKKDKTTTDITKESKEHRLFRVDESSSENLGTTLNFQSRIKSLQKAARIGNYVQDEGGKEQQNQSIIT